MRHRLLFVTGARPNFVKLAPLLRALAQRPEIEARVVHTGQHYDYALAGSFIRQLSLPEPDYYLGVGSGSHGEQTAGVIVGVERILLADPFDAIVVSGDVNSTLAAALAAAKVGVPIVHLEAGLRSRDWTMPEEINRVLTDRLSDLLLCHSPEAVDNLKAEGIPAARIALVGNTMIDSLFALLDATTTDGTLERLELESRSYVLVTLHRPSLVDDPERLAAVIEMLAELDDSMPVVLPLHPRTRARLTAERPAALDRLRTLDPLSYLDFVALESQARLVVTDSGGVQEETSALGVPCVTYRTTTERPITVELGTNRVVGVSPEALRSACVEELSKDASTERVDIPLWDGHAAPRAAQAVLALLDRSE